MAQQEQEMEFWTVEEAAPVLRIGENALYRALKADDGRFNGVRIALRFGKQWRIFPSVLRRLARGEEPY